MPKSKSKSGKVAPEVESAFAHATKTKKGKKVRKTKVVGETSEVNEMTVNVPEKTAHVPEETASVPEKTASVPEKTASVPEMTNEITEETGEEPNLPLTVKTLRFLRRNTRSYQEALRVTRSTPGSANRFTSELMDDEDEMVTDWTMDELSIMAKDFMGSLDVGRLITDSTYEQSLICLLEDLEGPTPPRVEDLALAMDLAIIAATPNKHFDEEEIDDWRATVDKRRERRNRGVPSLSLIHI